MKNVRILGVAALLLAGSGCVDNSATEEPESVRDPDRIPDSQVRPRAAAEGRGRHNPIGEDESRTSSVPPTDTEKGPETPAEAVGSAGERLIYFPLPNTF